MPARKDFDARIALARKAVLEEKEFGGAKALDTRQQKQKPLKKLDLGDRQAMKEIIRAARLQAIERLKKQSGHRLTR
ncbi:MAG: hypothetical protein ACP5O3_00440 [Candidatus Micrarchaeia archaeon]